MYTLQALQIFIFLIPGFIAATTLDHLIIRNTKKELERIIEALMFSMIIYTIYSLAFGAGPISFDEVNKSIMFDSKSFVFLSLISLIIPIIFSFLITNDLHMSIARKLQITRRSSRHSVWYDTFCDNQKYIIINFENGRRLYGWPNDYSDSQKNYFIYLTQPAWIIENSKTKKREYIDLDIDGILITSEQKIESIEFL